MAFTAGLRQSSLFKLIYRLKFLIRFYHYSLALLSALLFGFPSKKILVIGVTGTKGKTTVLEILNNILEEAGYKTALLSSLYVKIRDDKEKNLTDNTMPGRMFIQKFLRRAVKERCDYALVEVTSEGVMMSRHRFIKWRMGVITNLSPEHIEAHGSFEKYRAAKEEFLRKVYQTPGRIFLNGDDRGLDWFKNIFSGERAIWFSKKDLNQFLSSIDKSVYLLSTDFNQENLAAGRAAARSLRVTDEVIKKSVLKFPGVAGRMEFVQKEPLAVVVDYAHTPDSLERVYTNLRRSYKRLICVLGSAGGGRDKWKRPKMGKIAERFCSEIVLTNEDPYDEQPEAIIEEIALGCSKTRKLEIRKMIDRREAIRKAIDLAKKGDAVVITGKGNESYIHIEKGKKVLWSDAEIAKEILAKAN